MTPYDVQISRSLKWMHNKAPALTGLVLSKERWYDANQKAFWASWLSDVFDLRTANDFGMLVWCIILGVPSSNFSFEPPKHQFAYGALRENFVWSGLRYEGVPYDPNANDIGGNFSAARSGSLYDPEEIRRLLQIRYAALISDGSISFVNFMLRWVFNEGREWDFDSKRYFYVTDNSIATSEPVNITESRYDTVTMGVRYGQPFIYYNYFLYSDDPTVEENPQGRKAWSRSPTTTLEVLPQEPAFWSMTSSTPEEPNEVSISQILTPIIVPTGQLRVSFIVKATQEQQNIRVSISSNTGNHVVDFNVLYGNFETISPNNFGEASMEPVGDGAYLISMIAPRVPNQPVLFKAALSRDKQTVFGSPTAPNSGRMFVSKFQSESTQRIPYYRPTTAQPSGSAADTQSVQIEGNVLHNPSFNIEDAGGLPNGYIVGSPAGVEAEWSTIESDSGLSVKTVKGELEGLDSADPLNYMAFSVGPAYRPEVPFQTQTYQFSAYLKGTEGLSARIIAKSYNSAGQETIGTVGPSFPLTGEMTRHIVNHNVGFGSPRASIEIEIFSTDPSVTTGDVYIERPQINLLNVAYPGEIPWNDTENPGSRAALVFASQNIEAGTRFYWKGIWGASASGNWNYGGTFPGGTNTIALQQPSDYIQPVLSGRIEYRIGAGLGLTTQLIEILRDDNIRILPTFAGIRASVKLES